jgi:hypothetical protein
MWWPFRKRKRPEAIQRAVETTASTAMSALPTEALVNVVDPTAVVQALRRQSENIGLQGAPPIVTVSKNRHGTRCACGDVVLRFVRHICMYNAEYHLDTMTAAERAHVVAQLRAAGVPEPAALAPAVVPTPDHELIYALCLQGLRPNVRTQPPSHPPLRGRDGRFVQNCRVNGSRSHDCC